MKEKHVRWFIITLPVKKHRKRIIDEQLHIACSVLNIPVYHVGLFIPEMTLRDQQILKNRDVNDDLIGAIDDDLFQGYGFLCLPRKTSPGEFFQYFESPVNMLIVLKTVRTVKKIDYKVPAEINKRVVTRVSHRIVDAVFENNLPGFLEGDYVHVTKGVFKGFEGVVELVDLSKKEVHVKVYFLGADRTITADIEDLKKIEKGESNEIK